MNETERRKMETSLIRSGFKGMNDPELVPAFATIITNHEILRALLNDCSRMERGAMLEALRPHLPFEANPLDWYEIKTIEKFEAHENERTRIIAGDKVFEAVAKELATHAVVTMKCSKCPREKNYAGKKNYAGDTPLGAMILARQDGWVREKATNKEVCPKCECVDRSKRKKCAACTRRHYAPLCRMQGQIEPLKHGDRLTIGGAKKGEMNIQTGQAN